MKSSEITIIEVINLNQITHNEINCINVKLNLMHLIKTINKTIKNISCKTK